MFWNNLQNPGFCCSFSVINFSRSLKAVRMSQSNVVAWDFPRPQSAILTPPLPVSVTAPISQWSN